MTKQHDVEGELVMGWPSRRKIAASTVVDDERRVILARTPIADLEGPVTPTSAWFNIQHFSVPDPVDPADWVLTVDGAVKSQLKLTLDDLRQFPARTVRCFGECSGNDAIFFSYFKDGGEKPSRTPGQIMSAGEFTGTPLAAILDKAGIDPKAVSIRIEGFDSGEPRPGFTAAPGDTDLTTFNYDKGLPLEKALDPDTIVVWAMNGEYLEHLHGAPARLLVPGWATNWWVKWIQRIEVLDHPAECFYQTQYYYYGDSPDDPNKEMITSISVKSMITYPKYDDSTLPLGANVIRGLAWSGDGVITMVEVSVDGGENWHAAHIEEPVERWMWVRWSYPWDVIQPGEYTIMARATDADGHVQPREPRWNHLLKNFNAIIPQDVTVV